MARNKTPDGDVVVIGLGRFGKSLAEELERNGTKVLGVDASMKIVQSVAGELTHVVQADSTDEDALRQLGVQDFSRAVIAIGSDLEASILTASLVLQLGVRDVWAKAVTGAHARILEQLGVHHVVRPESDMGRRVAHLISGKLLDYIEFDDGYAIAKAVPPRQILGMTLGESNVRQKYHVTIVGVKSRGSGFTHATPDTVVDSGDLVIVSGQRDDVEAFAELA